MQDRIPIGTMVAVRKFAGDEWEPMFVVGHSYWSDTFGYHVKSAIHVYERFVREPKIMIAEFETGS